MKDKIKKLEDFVITNKNAVITGVATFVVVLLICSVFGMGHKVAVVDAQAVVLKSSQVAILKQEQEQKTQALQTWIDNAKADVEKQKNKKKKDELLANYNQEFVQKQQALAAEYVQKLQAIDKDITEVIAKEAKRLGFDMVATKGVILYGATDITEQVAAKIK